MKFKRFCLTLLIPVALVSVLAAGCAITTSNSGELGLRFGTDIAVYHRAADTNSSASAGLDFEEWFQDYATSHPEDTNTNGN
jgi:hypothetical protein